MMKTLLLALVMAGVSLAGVKTYDVQIFSPLLIGSTLLKPGEYTVHLEGDKAVFTSARDSEIAAEAGVKVRTADKKFSRTEVVFTTEGETRRIQRIGLKGSRVELQFN
jgi:hypothetical protein